MTTIFANGQQSETKVLAGGAVIGKQGTNGLSWTTADPVTGTTANLGYSSEFGTLFTKEEHEPLGQTLDLHDPADPPQPLPGEIKMGSADDPQWQCGLGKHFWGGFQGMPFHCQLKSLLNAGNKLPWEEDVTTILKFTPFTDSPVNVPDGVSPNAIDKSSLGARLTKRVLTSTSKKDGTGCDSDGDGKPDTPCNVNGPNLPIPDIPGHFDASFSQDKKKAFISLFEEDRRDLSKEESDKLKKGVQSKFFIMNGDKTCHEKLNDLLGKLESNNSDFNKMLVNLLAGEKDFKLSQTINPVKGYETKDTEYFAPAGQTRGGKIVLNSDNSFGYNVLTVIHELFHAANKSPNYTHLDIARAIAKLEGLDPNKIPKDIGGGFLNSWLEKYCSEGEPTLWNNNVKRYQ